MKTKSEIPTPALVVDLDAFERNVALMAGIVERAGKRLRPHAKAHKCVQVAQRQIAAGACGICVATVAEAEMMAEAGIPGLLLTSPVADPIKMARIVATGAMVAVDHVRQVAWYDEAAAAAGRRVDVLVDIDVGDHRTGARPGEQALAVAKAVDAARHLRLLGIQAYSVRGSHAGGVEERRGVAVETYGIAAETRDAFSRAGLAVEILTGGSTGSAEVEELTEIQAGSYVFMDMAYGRLGLRFENALTGLTTVVSANHAGFVTVDGGFKAFSADRGYGPEAVGRPWSSYRWGGDEFGYLDGEPSPELGERIEFVPPHIDPTVNLHDRIYACRGDRVEEIWAVMSRSRAARNSSPAE